MYISNLNHMSRGYCCCKFLNLEVSACMAYTSTPLAFFFVSRMRLLLVTDLIIASRSNRCPIFFLFPGTFIPVLSNEAASILHLRRKNY